MATPPSRLSRPCPPRPLPALFGNYCHSIVTALFVLLSHEPLESKDHVLFISTSPLPTVLGTWWVPSTYY